MEQNNEKPKEWSDLPNEVQSMVLPYLKFGDLVDIQRAGLIDQVKFKTGYLEYHCHMGQAFIDRQNYSSSFLKENCPWIKKMIIKMKVLYLNFLPKNVPAFLNAIRTMKPFEMENLEIRCSNLQLFEAIMKRKKNDRLDSVCLRGRGYEDYSSDNETDDWMEDIMQSPLMENVPVLMFQELGNVDIVTRLIKLWRTTDISMNKEAYAFNKHSFEPLRRYCMENGASKPTSRTYILDMKDVSKQLYLEVFPNKRESRGVFVKVVPKGQTHVEASIKNWYEITCDRESLAASYTGNEEDTDDEYEEYEEGFESDEDLTNL
ncbi:Protein CBG00276 [Caenorhabditis briggsae]|uniref:Uncharacterized protein n=2 Tax=Caenorhabditis briggsae TaxID=6238 RepID=A0AAE8ZV27_CAEBR|nr:Protein CBG00276 [Caenorhabditis briggsae]ULT83715.1 hypothetical protein L3Y34_012758 [Caenorhabditis briggsae]CAP21719.1 Protein CBG00276 [Caenorhabditis briggsae]